MQRQFIGVLLIACLGGCCGMGESRIGETTAALAQSKMTPVEAKKYMNSEGFDCYQRSGSNAMSCKRNKSCLTLFGLLFQGECIEFVDLILTPDQRAVDRVEIPPRQCFGQ
jgi:hypothetical protein